MRRYKHYRGFGHEEDGLGCWRSRCLGDRFNGGCGPARLANHVPDFNFDFSGPYVGVTAGVSWLHATADDFAYLGGIWNSYGYGVSGPTSTSIMLWAGCLVPRLGYNFPVGNFVYGVEGDISWLGGNSVTTSGSYMATGGYG